jgi:hypothetical protein
MKGDLNRPHRGDQMHFIETVGDTGPVTSEVRPTEGEPG